MCAFWQRSLSSAALAAFLALLAGCAGQVPPPTVETLRRAERVRPGAGLAELSAGRQAYVLRCSGCHSLKPPSSLPPEAWPAAVDAMAERARLTEDQRAAMSLYLQAASGRE